MKLLILALLAVPSWGAWGYYILHTPAALQVSGGPHTDFPVLIDTTHNDLRTTGNMGLVTDAQGDDIAPYSDATCSTLLPFELEAYDGTTGRIRMHVKVSSLSGSSNVYLCFQNASQTTSLANATGTWNSGYVCVYHFGNGSALTLTSSTSGTCTLTNSSSTADASGQIYGAMAMASASSQYAYVNSAIVSGAPLTISAWAKSSTTTGVQPIFTLQSSGSNLNMHRLILYQSKVQAQSQATGPVYGLAAASTNYSTSNWFHAAAVIVSATSRIAYYNGGNSGTETTSVTPSGMNKSQTRTESTDEYFNGSIDELRISNVARSADWLATEYNAGSPSTFWTVGSPTAITNSRRRMMIIQ